MGGSYMNFHKTFSNFLDTAVDSRNSFLVCQILKFKNISLNYRGTYLNMQILKESDHIRLPTYLPISVSVILGTE